jgi:hypothetical protein
MNDNDKFIEDITKAVLGPGQPRSPKNSKKFVPPYQKAEKEGNGKGGPKGEKGEEESEKYPVECV